jgi:hypothetical protein
MYKRQNRGIYNVGRKDGLNRVDLVAINVLQARTDPGPRAGLQEPAVPSGLGNKEGQNFSREGCV